MRGCAHSLKSKRINGHFVWKHQQMEVGGQSRQLCCTGGLTWVADPPWSAGSSDEMPMGTPQPWADTPSLTTEGPALSCCLLCRMGFSCGTLVTNGPSYGGTRKDVGTRRPPPSPAPNRLCLLQGLASLLCPFPTPISCFFSCPFLIPLPKGQVSSFSLCSPHPLMACPALIPFSSTISPRPGRAAGDGAPHTPLHGCTRGLCPGLVSPLSSGLRAPGTAWCVSC